MKKILLICTTALLFACSKDDASITNEEVALFVNHYKTTSVVSGTQLLIQENDAIGSDTFQGTAFIKNFKFEPGFTYNITAKKVITENAGTDAATISYELVSIDDQTQVSPQATFEIPIARFINGVGYVSFVRGTSTLGFILSQEITVACQNLCSQLEQVTPNQEAATGTFTHGPEGTYVLQGLY
ncbi:DUF4377 domain-containing protein [Rasiella sp. SM2506]|uniref:DUF4377 domain-containing protein n=1 Tax=Rasiella sp. SM2506 TaxID=3423914 RepID=UPI003D7BCD4A